MLVATYPTQRTYTASAPAPETPAAPPALADPAAAAPADTAVHTFPARKEVVEWSNQASVTNLAQMFRQAARANPQGRYLGVRQKGGTFEFQTYEQTQQQINRFASGLIELGLNPGDRVAQVSANRPEWVVTDMGTMHAACIHAPLYYLDSAEELKNQITDCKAKVVVVDNDSQLKRILQIEKDCPDLQTIVVMEPTQLTSSKNLVQWDDLMARGDKAMGKNGPEIDARVAGLKGTDIASMVYTSGTTGKSKGVMLHHANWVSSTNAMLELVNGEGGPKPTDLELSFLPLSHIFERSVYYAMTQSQAAVAYSGGVRTLGTDLKNSGATLTPLVPVVLEMVAGKIQKDLDKQKGMKKRLTDWAMKVGHEHFEARTEGKVGWWLGLKHKAAHKLVFSKIQEKVGANLNLIISGGAALDREVADFLNAIGITVSEGYGLSETLVLTANPPGRPKPGTVGKPLPGVQIKLSSEGEILVKSPSIMNGYLGQEEKTKEVFDAEGWFHTGDIGAFDPDGYLMITGRIKDMETLATGKKIFPNHIEERIARSDYIKYAVVVADRQQHPGAVLAPDFEALEAWAKAQGLPTDHASLVADPKVKALLKKEVTDLTDGLSDYEKVRDVIVTDKEFTEANGLLTKGGMKVKRLAVKKLFAQEIADSFK